MIKRNVVVVVASYPKTKRERKKKNHNTESEQMDMVRIDHLSQRNVGSKRGGRGGGYSLFFSSCCYGAAPKYDESYLGG